MSKQYHVELSIKDRVEIKPNAAGQVTTLERIHVPEGYVAIMSLRKQICDDGLRLGSTLALSKYIGHLSVQIDNRGAGLVELPAGKSIANLVFMKAEAVTTLKDGTITILN